MKEYNKCDTCGIENESVQAGRWLFYCDKPECKQRELNKVYDNEIEPALNSGDYPEDDEILQQMI